MLTRFALITLCMALVAAPALGAEDVWGGVFKFQSKLAEKGNPEAQFKLGEMYEDGRGVEQDERQALIWYTRAAEQGHAPAQERLKAIVAEKQRAAREAAERERARQEAEARQRQEAELARQREAEAREKARQDAVARQRAAEEKARQEALARKRAAEDKARQEALAAQRAREQARLEEERRREAAERARQEQLARERAPAQQETSAEFKANPCDSPAARFMSTCN